MYHIFFIHSSADGLLGCFHVGFNASFLSPLGCSHGLLALAFWGSVLLEIPAEGNGNPLQCSCLGNPMHRGAWQATVHGVTEELDTVTERSVFVEILKTAMSFIEWSSICG